MLDASKPKSLPWLSLENLNLSMERHAQMFLVNLAILQEPNITRNAELLLLKEYNGWSSTIPPCYWRLNYYYVIIRYFYTVPFIKVGTLEPVLFRLPEGRTIDKNVKSGYFYLKNWGNS